MATNWDETGPVRNALASGDELGQQAHAFLFSNLNLHWAMRRST